MPVRHARRPRRTAPGLERSLLVAVLLLCAASVGEAFAHGAAALFAWRLVEALGYVGVVVTAPVLIGALAGPQRAPALLALWSTFVPVGMALGTWGLGWLADGSGWRTATLTSGVAAGVCALAVWVSARPWRPRHRVAPGRAYQTVARARGMVPRDRIRRLCRARCRRARTVADRAGRQRPAGRRCGPLDRLGLARGAARQPADRVDRALARDAPAAGRGCAAGVGRADRRRVRCRPAGPHGGRCGGAVERGVGRLRRPRVRTAAAGGGRCGARGARLRCAGAAGRQRFVGRAAVARIHRRTGRLGGVGRAGPRAGARVRGVRRHGAAPRAH